MNYALSAIRLTQGSQIFELHFTSAALYVMSEFHERSWFVEIQGMDNPGLAESIFASTDIEMRMHAITANGVKLEGQCYVHPLMDASGVSLKGEGQLLGYEALLRMSQRE